MDVQLKSHGWGEYDTQISPHHVFTSVIWYDKFLDSERSTEREICNQFSKTILYLTTNLKIPSIFISEGSLCFLDFWQKTRKLKPRFYGWYSGSKEESTSIFLKNCEKQQKILETGILTNFQIFIESLVFLYL